MDFASIKQILNPVLSAISNRYDIDLEELSELGVDTIPSARLDDCLYKFKSGKKANLQCSKKAVHGGYCAQHHTIVLRREANLGRKKTSKTPKITKTQQEINDLVNTAVPQVTTELRRESQGLIHESSGLVFNEDFRVIGQLNKDQIVPLTSFEVDLCEKYGWCYLEEAVQPDSDSDTDSETES